MSRSIGDKQLCLLLFSCALLLLLRPPQSLADGNIGKLFREYLGICVNPSVQWENGQGAWSLSHIVWSKIMNLEERRFDLP